MLLVVSLGIFSGWGVANVTTVISNDILVIGFLFLLNVGASPCFHCTLLVPIYRCILPLSIIQLSVPVTGYILPACITKVWLLVLVWTCDFNLFLICVNSLEFMTECTHKVWLMVSPLCFYMTRLGASFTMSEHPLPTAMLIVTMISGPI